MSGKEDWPPEGRPTTRNWKLRWLLGKAVPCWGPQVNFLGFLPAVLYLGVQIRWLCQGRTGGLAGVSSSFLIGRGWGQKKTVIPGVTSGVGVPGFYCFYRLAVGWKAL